MPVAGISPDQAETLLQWVVYRTQKCLLERKRETSPTSPVALFTKPKEVAGECISSSAMACVQFNLLGTEVIVHHTGDLDESMVNSHLFLIVRMRVTRPNGRVEIKPYLVDTTFQQFFDPQGESRWGNKLLRKEGGRQFANDLMTQGFVTLNNKNAALYLDSHAEASMGLLKGNPLELLLRNSSDVPLSMDFKNWDLAVKDNMDIRTPSVIDKGLSERDAVQRYDALPATRLSSVIGEGKVHKPESGRAKPAERFF